MAERGISVLHCPTSNLKLGSGIAPVPSLMAAGVNVTLGTDGASSNNNLDLFNEIKLAAMLHKGANLDATILPTAEVLKMATVNGAKALGRKAGVLAAGWDADLIALDFDRPPPEALSRCDGEPGVLRQEQRCGAEHDRRENSLPEWILFHSGYG